jgi:hypothetical protein
MGILISHVLVSYISCPVMNYKTNAPFLMVAIAEIRLVFSAGIVQLLY